MKLKFLNIIIKIKFFCLFNSIKFYGDWGLAQSPIPNPQSPIPNQSNMS